MTFITARKQRYDYY